MGVGLKTKPLPRDERSKSSDFHFIVSLVGFLQPLSVADGSETYFTMKTSSTSKNCAFDIKIKGPKQSDSEVDSGIVEVVVVNLRNMHFNHYSSYFNLQIRCCAG